MPVFSAATNDTIDSNITIIGSSINVSANAFPEAEDSSYVLNLYSTPILFPILMPLDANESDFDLIADTEVIGFSIAGKDNVTNISVSITLQSLKGREGGNVSCFLFACVGKNSSNIF